MEIQRGVYTPILVHLENYDFSNTLKVVLTIKRNPNGKVLIKREFTEQRLYQVLITPEEAAKLPYSESLDSGSAIYDFDAILNTGERIPITKKAPISITTGSGNVSDY